MIISLFIFITLLSPHKSSTGIDYHLLFSASNRLAKASKSSTGLLATPTCSDFSCDVSSSVGGNSGSLGGFTSDSALDFNEDNSELVISDFPVDSYNGVIQ
jgi:hypothetical protein